MSPARTAQAVVADAGPSRERRRAVPRRELLPLGGQRRGASRKRGGTPMSKRETFDVIGKPRRRVDGRAKVTGQTRFADDIVLPRMLHTRLLRSPHPHARIVAIDTSRAERHPGVHLVLTGKDFPVTFGILPVSQDEYPLAPERVRYVGDPFAAVIAIDEQTAGAALDLIDVTFEVLPTIGSPEEALARPDVRIHDYNDHGNIHRNQAYEFGDVDAALAASDHVFEDLFFFEGNTHLPIEQHAAVAAVDGEGKLTLWSSTQVPHYVHRQMARALAIPESHIRIIACPNGGGFGGKTDICNHEAVVLKAALKLGRPVKICLNREEVFYMHRGRHPVLMKFRTGVNNDGKITGMHLQTLLDGGGYGSYGAASTFYTGALTPVTYELPRYKFEACRMFTNKPPCGPKRGHGTPQPRFGQEIQLDKIAAKLEARPGRSAAQHGGQARFAHRELAPDRHHRPGRMHPRGRGTLRVERALRQAARRARSRPRLRRLHVRRRPVDLLEQAAALGRAAADRSQRSGHRLLRRDGNRAGLGRCPGRHRGRNAGHRSLRSALRDRRHGPDADRPRLVFEPRHRDDGQRRDRSRREASGDARGRRRRSAADDAGANRAGAGPRIPRRRPRQERVVQGSGGDGRGQARHAGRGRLVHAAETPGPLQGRRCRPVPGVLVYGLRRGSRGGQDHRLDSRAEDLDRARHRPGVEPGARARPGRRLGLHGAVRGADGGADVPPPAAEALARARPSCAVDARVQEHHRARHARDGYGAGRGSRPQLPVRRQGSGAGARCCR